MMAGLLRWLAVAAGVACAAIGIYHLVLGIGSVPGEGSGATPVGVTVDSRERFYNAIFIGYGLAWLWVARQSPIPASAVRRLAGILLLGGVGRVISVAWYGWPHGFQVALAIVELTVPFVYFWLAPSDEKAARVG
jgi:uncharacterized protein DUF4345